MIKFGLHVFTWTSRMDNQALDYLPKLKEMGYDGIEIPLVADHLEFLDPVYVQDKLAETQMECVTGTGFTADMSIISDNPGIREKGMAHMKRCIDLTADVGAQLITGALYAPIGLRPQGGRTPTQWERSVTNLREIARYAAEKGVILGLEPLNRYEVFFLNTAADAVALAKAIGEPNVKVHLDTYHMNIEEKDIYRTVVETGEFLGHVHCSENDRGTPGTGHVDWDGLIRGLLEVNYDGWIVIESFFEPIPAISDLTPIWRKLAPSADVLAREGLEFIKKKLSQL
ncbi:MAG: sugar phosphate isomerase/epimerase [Firmicutes bacterium]|nr:sugar phosphate isomerase/epimerase [Bacillota bacterium]